MTRQGYDTPRRAFGKCHIATERVVNILNYNNHTAVPVRLSGYTGDLSKAYRKWRVEFKGEEHYLIHFMAFCDGVFVDFTARQFDADAPYPAVYSPAQVAANWRQMVYDGRIWQSDGQKWWVNESSIAPLIG